METTVLGWYGELVGRKVKTKTNINEEEIWKQIEELSTNYGPEDQQIDTFLSVLFNEALWEIFVTAKNGKGEVALQKIRELERKKESYGSQPMKDYLSFHLHRLKAYVYCCSQTWIKAVRAANIAIGKCPVINGNRANALSDVLILVSEAYVALDKSDDALHSAKLAIDISHDVLEIKKEKEPVPPSPSKPVDIRTPLGPSLPPTTAVSLAYHNLARQLRNREGMYQVCQGWCERAIQAAVTGKLDSPYILYLQNFLLNDSSSSAPQGNPTQFARQQSVVLFRQESEMSVLVDEDRNETLSVPLKSSNNYTSLPLITRSNSDRDKNERHSIFPVPSHTPLQINHQNHSESLDIDDGQNSGRSGRALSIEKQIVGSRTTQHQVDTAMPLDTKTRSQIQGQSGKGRRSPTPKTMKDHGDEISHLTDEEVAYTPMSNNKQRPKSAVSKLGGYDNRSVNSAMPADEPKKPIAIETKDLSSTSDSSRSKVLGNNIPLNMSMTRNIVEFELPSISDSQTYTLESLEALREAFNKQIAIINRERQHLDHLKLMIKEQAQLENKALKLKKIQEIKQKKRIEKELVNEMEFERFCISNERIGYYEAILRAQNLYLLSSGKSLSSPDIFFEGMIVDIKHSLKANSSRDRCVIIRCRVNGTFDAEVIATGVLLTNVEATYIRCPPTPEIMEEKGHLKPPTRKNKESFREGQRIQCISQSGHRWFTGYIDKIHQTGTCQVEYLDGSFEDNISVTRLRSFPPHSNHQSSSFEYSGMNLLNSSGTDSAISITQPQVSYHLGEQVLMKYVFGHQWRVGTIVKLREKDIYDVLLVGCHEVEKGISASCLRPLNSTLYGTSHTSPPTPTIRPETTRKLPERARSKIQSNSAHFCHPLIETEVRNLSSALPPPGSPDGKSARPPKPLNMRDQYAQEMHQNTAAVTAITTERKHIRMLRNEIKRIDGAVRIQAAIRGYLARNNIRREIGLYKQRKILEHQELEWLSYDGNLLDAFADLVKVALNVLKNVDGQRIKELKEVNESKQLLENKIQEILMSRERNLEPESNDNGKLEQVTEAPAMMTLEQMRGELISMQEAQLIKQREELEILMKGIGQEMTSAILTMMPRGPPVSSIEDDSGDGDEVPEEENTAENLEETELPLPDIENIKNLYLPLWGNDSFPPVEIVSLVASSTVEYSLLESSIDNSPSHFPLAIYPLSDNESFKNIHWTIFTRDISKPGAASAAFYLMKIRLNSTSGKTCKLKFPAPKIADICVSRKSVNVSLNELTKFEISGTSLRVDGLADCLLKLWDCHVAWVTQKIITSATLFENLQYLLKMIFEQSSIFLDKNENPEQPRKKKSKKVIEAYPIGWLTQRFDLISCLTNIIKETKAAKLDYEQTVGQCIENLSNYLKKWGYYPGSTESESDKQDPASLPWNLVSKRLWSLVENIFDPFQTYLSYTPQQSPQDDGGTTTTAISKSIIQQGHVNYQPFHDSLLSRHESHHSKIYPILKAIFLDFIRDINIEPIFNRLLIEPLMQLCHDRWVTAFAHCENYPWDIWCQGNQQWVQFMEASFNLTEDRFKSNRMIHKFYELFHNAEDCSIDGLQMDNSEVTDSLAQDERIIVNKILNYVKYFIEEVSIDEA